MNKCSSVLLALLMALFISGAATAQQQQTKTLIIDPKWTACQSNAECTAIGAECGAPMGVNAQYADIYRSAMSDMLRAQCANSSSDAAAMARNTVSYCRNNSCYSFIPNTFGDPMLYLCTSNADCTHVPNVCGLAQGVAIVHANDFSALVQRANQANPRACQGVTQDMQQRSGAMHDICLNQQCTLVP